MGRVKIKPHKFSFYCLPSTAAGEITGDRQPLLPNVCMAGLFQLNRPFTLLHHPLIFPFIFFLKRIYISIMSTRIYPHSCFLAYLRFGYWNIKLQSLPYFFISDLPSYNLKSVHIAVKEVKATRVDICELNFNEKNTSSAGKGEKTAFAQTESLATQKTISV